MVSASHRDVVLRVLRLSPRPLDDDQLSDRTGIRPRQQVNQICRGLQREGLVRRYVGEHQKIVNEQVSPTGPDPTPARIHPAAGPRRKRRSRAAPRQVSPRLGAVLLVQVLWRMHVSLPGGRGRAPPPSRRAPRRWAWLCWRPRRGQRRPVAPRCVGARDRAGLARVWHHCRAHRFFSAARWCPRGRWDCCWPR